MSVQEEDRITNLPDSLLHCVLSLLDIKEVARTSVLSKRWYYIWTSIPTLDFRSLNCPATYDETREYTYCESSKFMDLVDRILHLHDMSSLQKFYLHWSYPLSESRVSIWISAAIRRNVEELSLTLFLNSTFFTPLSLCTCESLVTLELDIFPNLYLPKYMSFPKLKHFKLSRVKFSDKYNNEQLFSCCPVLENLTLEKCEWFDMKNFCLSIPSLKVLKIYSLDSFYKLFGLQNCGFEIHAPSLESLIYKGDVAREYVISDFLALAEVDVFFGYLNENDTSEKARIDQGYNLSKFFQALVHVKRLTISDRTLQVLSFTHDLMNNLPTFHNLKKLDVSHDATSYEPLIALLQSAPNLESIVFHSISARDVESDEVYCIDLITTKCLFPHLKSVYFENFCCDPSEEAWVELILQQATTLETMIFPLDCENEIRDIIDLTSLPRASASCVFNFKEMYPGRN